MKKNNFFASKQVMTAVRTLLTAILLMTGLNGAWADIPINPFSNVFNVWGGSGGVTSNDVYLVERYYYNRPTGLIMSQAVSSLPNGTYDVVVYAHACHANNVGGDFVASDNTLSVNGSSQTVATIDESGVANLPMDEYTFSNVSVTDGTMNIRFSADAAGANWFTICVKSVTLKGTFTDYTNLLANADISAQNKDGQDITGWTSTNFKSHINNADFTGTFAEMWSGAALDPGSLSQTVNLPAGIYMLSANMRSRRVTSYLYASIGAHEQKHAHVGTDGAGVRALTFVVTSPSNVTVGIKHDGNPATGGGDKWIAVDDFKLTRLGDLLESTSLTSQIANPSFESGDLTCWTNSDMEVQDNMVFEKIQGSKYAQRWHVAGEKSVKQTLSGLPAGRYNLKVAAQAGEGTGVKIYAGSQETTVTDANDYEVNFFNNGSDVEIGYIATGTATSWLAVDNFRMNLLSPYATSTTSGSALNAGQWYAFTIGSAGRYWMITSADATLYYTQTGTNDCPDLSTTTQETTTSKVVGPVALSAGTLYVYSSAAVTLTLNNQITPNPSFEVDDPESLAATNNNSDGLRGYGQAENSYQPTGWTVTGNQSVSLLVNTDCFTDNNFGKVTSIPNGTRALYLRQGHVNGSTQVRTSATLPSGSYKMLIKQRTAYANNATSSFTLVAGSERGESKTFEVGSAKCFEGGAWTEEELFFYLDEETTVSLGLDITWVSGGSCIMIDDLRIISATEFPTLTLETRPMRHAEDEAQTAAAAAHTASPTGATFTTLKKAIADAKYSADCYAAADATLTKVQTLLSKTNVYTYEAYQTFYGLYDTYKELYDERTLDNDVATQLEHDFFGTKVVHQKGVAVVPFLGSAWDDNGDYTWDENTTDNYWVNTWSNVGDDDGSQFVVPFIEYWRAPNGGDDLPEKTMTATIPVPAAGNYTVYADAQVRKRNGASQIDLGKIKMEVGNTAIQLSNATYGARQSGSTPYYLTNPTTNRLQVTGAATQNASGDYELKIKFIVENGSGASWLAFQNVWVDFTGHTSSVNITQLESAISDAESHRLGFWSEEYTPWRNADALLALEKAKLIVHLYNNGSGADAINPAFVKEAYDDLTSAVWTPNDTDEETNGFYWKTDFTKNDIFKAWDQANGVYRDTFWPKGWDLGGSAEPLLTRISSPILNKDDVGLAANDDELALMSKRSTNYGNEAGYTLPLKPNTKYSLTFLYTDWANPKAINEKTGNPEAVDFAKKTFIRVYRKGDKSRLRDIYLSDGNVLQNWVLPTEDEYYGNMYEDKWTMFRGYFFTDAPKSGNDPLPTGEYTHNEEYVIEFVKEEQVEQQQIAMGELYLLRYRDDVDVVIGKSKTMGETYKSNLHAQNVRLERVLSHGATDQDDGHYWNTLVLPFKMSQKEVVKTFGVDKVFYYTGTTTHSYDAESNTYYATLHFQESKKGIMANVPVLFPYYYDKTKYPTDEALFLNRVMKASSPHPIVVDPNGAYDFVGTYETMKIPSGGIYIGSSNMLKASTGTTGLQPTRAYFKRSPNGWGDSGTSEVKLVGIAVDDVETGIAIMEEDGSLRQTSGNIYTLDGRLVRQGATSLRGLTRGVYIVDGRKILVK